MTPGELFSKWANVANKTNGELGYSGRSVISPRNLDAPRNPDTGYRLPKDIQMPGLSAFVAVEKALDGLPDGYRIILALEQGLIRPPKKDLRTSKQRAEFAGITPKQYRAMLTRLYRRTQKAVKC